MQKRPPYLNEIKTLISHWEGTVDVKAARLALLCYKQGYPISERTVRAWYYQEKQPSGKAINALCNIFNCNANDLLKFL